MPKFEICIKKIRYGHAIVYARDKEEAQEKLSHHTDVSKIVMYVQEDTQQLDCVERIIGE